MTGPQTQAVSLAWQLHAPSPPSPVPSLPPVPMPDVPPVLVPEPPDVLVPEIPPLAPALAPPRPTVDVPLAPPVEVEPPLGMEPPFGDVPPPATLEVSFELGSDSQASATAMPRNAARRPLIRRVLRVRTWASR